jgi:hypothetical protein
MQVPVSANFDFACSVTVIPCFRTWPRDSDHLAFQGTTFHKRRARADAITHDTGPPCSSSQVHSPGDERSVCFMVQEKHPIYVTRQLKEDAA